MDQLANTAAREAEILAAWNPPTGNWALLGMGKLGARTHLGHGDSDLLIVFDGGDQAEFDAAAQSLCDSVPDVDFSYHSHGGGLAMSVGSFEAFFSHLGGAEDPARQALVRMRGFAGDSDLIARCEAHRDSYCFSGVQMDMEALSNVTWARLEQKRIAGKIHVCRDPGGLCELEYGVEGLQITHSIPSIATMDAVDALEAAGHIDAIDATMLRDAYSVFVGWIDQHGCYDADSVGQPVIDAMSLVAAWYRSTRDWSEPNV